MISALSYPPVDAKLREEIVRAILRVAAPLKIVLFGSHARGHARPDSDLDLLIIEHTSLPRHERSVRYYLALADLFPSKDIVVYTPEEAHDWARVPNAFITTTLREGEVLYAR